ncbi:hypothetical protein GXB85_09575, partial [Cellulomonas sp. APG4]|uniref:hypothetical protein n=1 Tax=Cellulomonas sp. APG4 TaxID=1538656 RepID=UPI001379C589
MPYTLTSPTALVVDAACRVRAVELLGTLGRVFRLDDAEATVLGLHALDDDARAVERAWEVATEVDAATPSTVDTLLSAAPGALPRASTLARTGLGGVRDVVRLVVREAAAWPTAPLRDVPGVGPVPGGGRTARAVVQRHSPTTVPPGVQAGLGIVDEAVAAFEEAMVEQVVAPAVVALRDHVSQAL